MSPCFCGSSMPYQQCCQPIHHNHAMAEKPEQLMRARYSAHHLKLIDFIIHTYHPDCNAEQQREEIISSAELNWQKLTVISAPQPEANEGFVEFKASFLHQGTEQIMHERSRFLRQDGLWYYVDGQFPEKRGKNPGKKVKKTGRNDPCHCGSGKKFKKCCGR